MKVAGSTRGRPECGFHSLATRSSVSAPRPAFHNPGSGASRAWITVNDNALHARRHRGRTERCLPAPRRDRRHNSTDGRKAILAVLRGCRVGRASVEPSHSGGTIWLRSQRHESNITILGKEPKRFAAPQSGNAHQGKINRHRDETAITTESKASMPPCAWNCDRDLELVINATDNPPKSGCRSRTFAG